MLEARIRLGFTLLLLLKVVNLSVELVCDSNFVCDGSLRIIVRIHFKILNDIRNQMSALHLASNFILQASIVNVEMHELRMIMDKDAQLITWDTICPLDRSNSLVDHGL